MTSQKYKIDGEQVARKYAEDLAPAAGMSAEQIQAEVTKLIRKSQPSLSPPQVAEKLYKEITYGIENHSQLCPLCRTPLMYSAGIDKGYFFTVLECSNMYHGIKSCFYPGRDCTDD